ncbi:ProQ/FINO family protein [Natronospirillum operosum]|uniref:ProQ/FINO family protein n=1 Tax=Natronospirillum operosum TaxID=2759953 RepID=UPI0014366E3F|nr:ProQ/FinO family protein [Natronospirillum operosum]
MTEKQMQNAPEVRPDTPSNPTDAPVSEAAPESAAASETAAAPGSETAAAAAAESASPGAAPNAPKEAPKVHPNRAAYDLLSSTYPHLFDLKAPKPLKIGIHVSLAEDGKLSKTKIRRALNFYVRQLAYIRAVSEGGKRYDLQGEAGEVSAEDAAHAKARVEEIEARRAARRQERQQQRRKPAEQQRRKSGGKAARAPRAEAGKGKPGQAPRDTGRKQTTSDGARADNANPEERLNAKLENLARRFNRD